MAAHYVICKFCNQKFNRDKEDAVAVEGRRYVHKTCYDEYIQSKGQEEQDYIELENYIKKIFNEPTVNAKIKKQISNFKKEYNYTYSGMLKTLIWWFDVKKNSIEKANGGIGIVPFVYQEAWNYYYTLYLAEVANSIEDIENYTIKTQEITIPSPRIEVTPPKLFNMDKWEEADVN